MVFFFLFKFFYFVDGIQYNLKGFETANFFYVIREANVAHRQRRNGGIGSGYDPPNDKKKKKLFKAFFAKWSISKNFLALSVSKFKANSIPLVIG